LKVHVYFSFLVFPRRIDPGSARLKKGKKVPGEKLPALIPNPDLFLMTVASSFKRISPAWRDQNSNNAGPIGNLIPWL
jgi:hypothetical protein